MDLGASIPLTLLGKAADFGSLHREVNINGSTLVTGIRPAIRRPVLPAVCSPRPSNSGNFNSNAFTVVPEIGLTFTWDITDSQWRLSTLAILTVLVLYNAVRAADQDRHDD